MECGWLLALQLLFLATTWTIFLSSTSSSPRRKRSRMTTRSGAIRDHSKSTESRSSVSSSEAPSSEESSSATSSSSGEASPSSSLSSVTTALPPFNYEEARIHLTQIEGLSEKSRKERIRKFDAILTNYWTDICATWGEAEFGRMCDDIFEAIKTEQFDNIKITLTKIVYYLNMENSDTFSPFTRKASMLMVRLMEDKLSNGVTLAAATSFELLLSSIKHKGVSARREIWTEQWRALRTEMNAPEIDSELLDRLIECLFACIRELGKDTLSVKEVEEIGELIENCLNRVKKTNEFCMVGVIGQITCGLIETIGADVCYVVHPWLALFFSLSNRNHRNNKLEVFWVSQALLECASEYSVTWKRQILDSIRYWRPSEGDPSEHTSSNSIVTLLTWIIADVQDEELNRTTEESSEQEGTSRDSLLTKLIKIWTPSHTRLPSRELLTNIAVLFEAAEVKDGEVIPLVFSLIDKCDDNEWAVSICRTIIEKSPQSATNHHIKMGHLFLESLSDKNRIVRSHAALAFGRMAKSGIAEWVKLASQSIASLVAMVDQSINESSRATKNAIHSLVTIISKCEVDEEAVNNVLVCLIDWIPLVLTKKKNARVVYKLLADRIQKKNESILGKLSTYQIVHILTEAGNCDLLESMAAKERIINVMTEIQDEK